METLLPTAIKATVTAFISTIARCAFSSGMKKRDCIRFFIVAIFVIIVILQISGIQNWDENTEKMIMLLGGFLGREVIEFVLIVADKAKKILPDKLINKIK